MKKILKYFIIRIGVLLICLSIMFIIWYFNNDPHKHCDLQANEHRHTDNGLGLFVGGFMVAVIWITVLFIEGIMYNIKKEKNTLSFILMIILVLGIFALVFI